MKRHVITGLILIALCVGVVQIQTMHNRAVVSNMGNIPPEMRRLMANDADFKLWDLTPEAEAQNTPGFPTGSVAVAAMGSGVTGSLLAPQSILLGSPGATAALQIAATNQLRNYVYSAYCLNTSSTATVAILWDSGTLASAATPTVTQVGYIPCPLSMPGGQQPVVFSPPIRLRQGSALGISTHVSVTTAFYYANGYQAR